MSYSANFVTSTSKQVERLSDAMAPATNPGGWSSSVLTWALRLLVAAVALRLALSLLESVVPALIVIASFAALLYVIFLIIKVRRSGW